MIGSVEAKLCALPSCHDQILVLVGSDHYGELGASGG